MNNKEAERRMGIAIRLISTGLTMYAQAYSAWAKDTLDDPDYKLGNDYILGEAWKDIAHAVTRSFLNGPFRGFEPATISREIEQAAKNADVDLT